MIGRAGAQGTQRKQTNPGCVSGRNRRLQRRAYLFLPFFAEFFGDFFIAFRALIFTAFLAGFRAAGLAAVFFAAGFTGWVVTDGVAFAAGFTAGVSSQPWALRTDII